MSKKLIEALSVGPEKKQSKCSVGAFLSTLSAEEKEAVLDALNKCRSSDPSMRHFTFAWLSKTITEDGYRISALTIRRHARGDCACDGSTR